MQDAAPPIVRGEKVWLRAFERRDLDAYHRCVNHAEVAFWAGYGGPQSREGVEAWYDTVVKTSHGRGSMFLTICLLGEDEFLGTTWLRPAERFSGLELSVYIGDTARWGTGIGTDAVNATLDAAFGLMDVDRVWLFTSAENTRSQRAFEKAGFVREGRLRGDQLRRGRRVDSVLMALLRREWEALERPRSWHY